MADPIMPHAPKGRYARGEETRQRIIDTAVEIFGRKGFTDTSTRDIAAAAGINTPAIQYYFENKLGLYTACIDQLTDRIWARIGPPLEACQAVLSGRPSLNEVIASASAVQNCLIDSFFADSEGLAIRRMLAWAEAENTAEPLGESPGKFMKQRVGLPIFATFRQIVEYVSPVPMEKIRTDLHASALVGTSMIFHFDRGHHIQFDGCDQIDDTFIATFKSVANTSLAFALRGLSAHSVDAAPA